MSIATRSALRSSLRCLHTTARLCNESSSSTPPASSGSSLGFGDYTGRTRKLPTIPISPSSQRNVLKSRAPKANPTAEASKPASPQGQGETGRKRAPQDRQKRQGRSPIQASVRQARETSKTSEASVGEEDFFGEHVTATPRNRGSGLKKVNMDMDFATPSSFSKSTSNSRGQRNGRASTLSPRTTSANKRDGEVKERRARAPIVPEVEDRSPEGIFGRASLLFPVRRGAREAERSIWSENFQPVDGTLPVYHRCRSAVADESARKAEMARLAGSPAVYLPNQPLPMQLTGKNAPRASKMLGTWLLSTNPSVSMRRAKGGEAIINSYLK